MSGANEINLNHNESSDMDTFDDLFAPPSGAPTVSNPTFAAAMVTSAIVLPTSPVTMVTSTIPITTVASHGINATATTATTTTTMSNSDTFNLPTHMTAAAVNENRNYEQGPILLDAAPEGALSVGAFNNIMFLLNDRLNDRLNVITNNLSVIADCLVNNALLIDTTAPTTEQFTAPMEHQEQSTQFTEQRSVQNPGKRLRESPPLPVNEDNFSVPSKRHTARNRVSHVLSGVTSKEALSAALASSNKFALLNDQQDAEQTPADEQHIAGLAGSGTSQNKNSRRAMASSSLNNIVDNNINIDLNNISSNNVNKVYNVPKASGAIRKVTVRNISEGSHKPSVPSSVNPSKSSAPAAVAKKIRIPPIMASIPNIKQWVSSLAALRIENFRYNVNIKSGRTTIYADDRATFEALIKTLKENKLRFFAQSPSDARRINLIMKNVPHGFDVDDVKEAVSRFGLGDNLKVFPLKDGNKAAFNYFILSFPPSVDVKQFVRSHRMFHTTVKIEKYNNTTVPQCYKCSQLGHYQNYCGLDRCCHRCGKEHEEGSCTLDANAPTSQLFCVLCLQHGHAASYKGCPVYKDEVKRVKEVRANRLVKSSTTNKIKSSPLVSSNFSYSQVASLGNGSGTVGIVPTQNPQNDMSLNNVSSFLDVACLEAFGCPYAQFLPIFKTFHFAFNSTNNRETKRSLLMDFFSKFP